MNNNETLKQSICLNMIVKNESHIIIDTLTKLLHKIKFDYWVISDTGSTDGTQELIKDFFNKHCIKGELFEDSWKDFGHNRTLALQEAFDKTDYLVIFDADDEICNDFKLPTRLTCDYYHFKFGNEHSITYTRPQLVNNRIKWRYKGVLHEYLDSFGENRTSGLIDGDYYTISGRTSSRNQDPDKYYKDALILEKAFEEAKKENDDIYNRYAFYCGNSYHDCNRPEKAIEWYKKTLDVNGWIQEKYISCLRIFENYDKIGEKENSFYYLVKSFEYDRERCECLYELVKHYCCINQNEFAYMYYVLVRSFYERKYIINDMPKDKLFIDNSKAEFFLPYYMIIVCEKTKNYESGIQMYRIIFHKKFRIFDNWWIGNLLFNLQFFIDKVTPYTNPHHNDFFIKFSEYLEFLSLHGYNLHNHINDLTIYNKYDIPMIQKLLSKGFSLEACKESKNILFYTGFSDNDWNYTYSLDNALGGSEKAVAYLSKYLPKNYNIFISGGVKEEQIDNIHYVPFYKLLQLLNNTPFHIVIISRYISFFEMYPHYSSYKTYIWAHDTMLLPFGCNMNENDILEKWKSKITGCICQTEWHKNLYESIYPSLHDKIYTINNGLLTHLFIPFQNIQKIKNRFIYSSCSERGLMRLLHLWPTIINEIPDAELFIASYNKFPKNNDDEKMLEIINMFPNSITYVGKLDAKGLYELMASAEYWLYTSYWEETSCITSMEMLMSKVICIYYPVAGLVNTIKDYGFPINEGDEIKNLLYIVNLNDDEKNKIRNRGYKYAINCSWENRALKWNKILFTENNKLTTKNIFKNKIAIFNSFPFHYEMFGYILHFAKNNNYHVDIYTNFYNNIGWINFYNKNFKNVTFLYYKEYQNIKYHNLNYKYIFVTTDDDYEFKDEWIYDNVICINHFFKIRNPNYKNYLNCTNYKNSTLLYAISCFPLITSFNKKQNNVVTIIGEIVKFNFDNINRLKFIDNDKIILNIIGRSINEDDHLLLQNLDKKFEINFLCDLDTSDLIEILKNTSYIFVNYSNYFDFNYGQKSSGSIALAYSTLCCPIICKQSNDYFKLKNAIEFDLYSNDEIILNNINFQDIENSRNTYINFFNNYLKNINNNIPENKIPKLLFQTWKDDNFSNEFNEIRNTWKNYNPEYSYYLFTDNDCDDFIKNNFNNRIYDAYLKIIPGAYKSDLWRYCILYKYGGVYCDIDTLCLNKIDNFLDNNITFMIPIDLNQNPNEGNYNLFNAFIAIEKDSNILLECINNIVYNIENNIIPYSKLDFSGPGLIGRSVNKYLHLQETESFKGKEGIVHNIHFLYFEPYTEYVKNSQGLILFQNKNGNLEIIKLYNNECLKTKNINWVNCIKILKQQYYMLYNNYFDRRTNTFKKSFELLLQNNTNENTYNIVELGTSRSFVSGRIENNKDFYNPQDPSSWDWGAGIFTKVFNDNLLKYNSNFVLYTIDPCENALYVSKTMNNNSNNIKFIKDYSTNFLNNIDFKIDFLYMDHMESSEEACLLHLNDAKLIVEKNIMAPNGIILIDDVDYPNFTISKGKYSIPYFLNNNFKMILGEYQVLLVKNN